MGEEYNSIVIIMSFLDKTVTQFMQTYSRSIFFKRLIDFYLND
jgi:hypothetical protein